MAEKINNEANDDMYEIIRGISQAASLRHDTYRDEEEDKIGLRREEGNPLVDKRIMDGFGIKISGRKLTINYHTEVPLQEISKMGPSKYEGEVEDMIEKCLTFLKKQYKKDTGKVLAVKELKKELRNGKSVKDFDVLIQPISRFRTSVMAHKCYELTGIPEPEEYKSDIIDQYEKYHKGVLKNKKKAEDKPKRIA